MKPEPIRIVTYKNHIIRIWHDDFGDNPRDYEPLGIMITRHHKFNLPNESGLDLNDYEDWGEVYAELIKRGAIYVHQVIMYDHGGVTLRSSADLTATHEPWDTSVIGFVYTTRERIMKEFHVRKINQDIAEEARKIICQEVSRYGQYINGDGVGYTIEQPDGTDDGMAGTWYDTDDALQDAKDVIDHLIETGPRPRYFVCMTDETLTGWGTAKNKVHRLVIECWSLTDAMCAYKSSQARSEMKNVELSDTPPPYWVQRYVDREKYEYLKGRYRVHVLTEANGALNWFDRSHDD